MWRTRRPIAISIRPRLFAAAIWFVVELVRGFTGDRTRSVSTVRDADGHVSQQETEVRETRVQEP